MKILIVVTVSMFFFGARGKRMEKEIEYSDSNSCV
jgi:hypothetical protein